MELKKMYVAEVTKFNLGEICFISSEHYDYYPYENDIIEFIKECNLKNERLRHFDTKVFIKEYFDVL